ncbi:hypothetical protein AB870_26505 (plasmid) [Pandoraea faecigallinarum]|uniref:Uncharacterized protein n=1 Tax=Pandoraea faecigallinarum TaxID=656179 RepID=A0A1D8X6N0_9BURK|nr:hypothetical protein [Pandoraea faecigallinarum]AOX47854.1 hypothetical protein AB870_26505 [Pandoraea faecigallinarum]
MKQPKGVDDLAARLGAAVTSPLVSPAAVAPAPISTPEPAAAPAPVRERTRTVAKTAGKGAAKKEPADTMQLTLRPSRTLFARYVAAAADRSRQLGRVVSAQEIMLEILEKGAV